MSRNSPVCTSIRFQDSPKLLISSRNASITSTKMRLKHSVIKKIYAASIEKARFSLMLQKENCDERLDTLVSVEREFVQNLICFRKIKRNPDSLSIPYDQKTLKNELYKNIKGKRTSSISSISHSRKIAIQRKAESGYCFPDADTLTKAQF